jgi:hypothetical protein
MHRALWSSFWSCLAVNGGLSLTLTLVNLEPLARSSRLHSSELAEQMQVPQLEPLQSCNQE